MQAMGAPGAQLHERGLLPYDNEAVVAQYASELVSPSAITGLTTTIHPSPYGVDAEDLSFFPTHSVLEGLMAGSVRPDGPGDTLGIWVGDGDSGEGGCDIVWVLPTGHRAGLGDRCWAHRWRRLRGCLRSLHTLCMTRWRVEWRVEWQGKLRSIFGDFFPIFPPHSSTDDKISYSHAQHGISCVCSNEKLVLASYYSADCLVVLGKDGTDPRRPAAGRPNLANAGRES